MKSERITFRLTETEKEELLLSAKKQNMGISEYIISCIKDKQEISDLNDSQGQFLNLFDNAYKKSSGSNFNRLMVLLNKTLFNTNVLIKVMDTYMKQLKIPQSRDDVITTFVEHPIITIAEENTIKEFRKTKQKKEEINNIDE